MYFLLRLLINAAALWVAIRLLDGIDHRGSWWSLLVVALVFGALNASVRPLLKLLSLPLLVLTLGLFIFVINALMLLLTGGFIVTVVSLLLSMFTGARKMKVRVESYTIRS